MRSARSSHKPFHKPDIIIFRQIAIFLCTTPIMSRHSLDEFFNEFVRDEGVAKVEFCYIWLLSYVSKNLVTRRLVYLLCHQQPL